MSASWVWPAPDSERQYASWPRLLAVEEIGGHVKIKIRFYAKYILRTPLLLLKAVWNIKNKQDIKHTLPETFYTHQICMTL